MESVRLFCRARRLGAAFAALVLALALGEAVAPQANAAANANISAFKGLGAWVDVYDYTLDAWQASGVMQANGVKTIYLQTGRWNSPTAANTAQFTDKGKVDWWVHSAHARGMKIVGWYLPAYDDMVRDVRRTAMIWTYRTGRGHHFDGVAIDIEYRGQVRSQSGWNAAVADHARRVRNALGWSAPIASITPAPLGMAIRPSAWAGFPWRALGAVSNVFMPMGYWSYRTDCPQNPHHCAHSYTEENVIETRRLVGNWGMPVHPIGGVADKITVADVRDFVIGAQHSKSYGASLYDYRTTAAELWPPLAPINSL